MQRLERKEEREKGEGNSCLSQEVQSEILSKLLREQSQCSWTQSQAWTQQLCLKDLAELNHKII